MVTAQNKKCFLPPNIMYEQSFPIFQSYKYVTLFSKVLAVNSFNKKGRVLKEDAYSLQESVLVHDWK